MKNISKVINKGEQHYRSTLKRHRVCICLLFALAIIIQVILSRVLQSQQLRVLFTVMAILTVLPFANICSPLLATWNIHSPNQSKYDEISVFEDRGIMLYDLILTMREQIMPICFLCITDEGIILYQDSSRADSTLTKRFIREQLNQHNFSGDITIYTEYDAFKNHLSSLNASSKEISGKYDAMVKTIKSLSM